ncbi:MAG: GNAT family N-acetyltransferase [Gammaproteobacteria bacterium]
MDTIDSVGAEWRLAAMHDISTVLECFNTDANKEWLEGVPEHALVEALTSDSRRLLIYQSGNEALAFAYLSHLGTNEPKLEEFAVFPAGHGCGTRSLVSLIEYVSRDETNTRLWLHVVTHNHRAIHIYRKLGFGDQSIVEGGWTNRLGQNVTIYRLWKNLRPENG